MPRSFQDKYPKQMKNLRLNSRKLTTPFDINETFKHLLNFDDYERGERKPSRGISLFKNIPLNRTCEDAQIEAHWCSCLNWKSIDIMSNSNNQITKKKFDNRRISENSISKENNLSQSELKNFSKYSNLALFLALESVKFINSLIDKELKIYCQELSLHSIHKLSSLIINRQVLAFKQSKDIHGREAMFDEISKFDQNFEQDVFKSLAMSNVSSENSTMVNDHLNFEHVFQIVLTTWPGNGTFELSCRYNRYSGRIKFNKNEISRINSYKSSADCIVNKRPDLRQYCFCK